MLSECFDSNSKRSDSAQKLFNKKIVYRLATSAPMDVFPEEEILRCQKRKEALQAVKYPTLENDFELKLLNDPETFRYARRITELEFNENRTEKENHELELLKKPQTRKYAQRIIALEYQKNKSKLEALELAYLKNDLYREHTYVILDLIEKDSLYGSFSTFDYRRALDFYLNEHTIKRAAELIELESRLDELNSIEMQCLSKDYLLSLAKVSCLSKHDFHKDLRSVSDHPNNDCIILDRRYDVLDRDIARFKATEDAFNSAAKKLIQNYFKQASRCAASRPQQATGLFPPNLMDNPRIQKILFEREVTLALVLIKLFFDNKIDFTQEKLDAITNHLNDLVIKQKLTLNTAKFDELDKIIVENLQTLQAPQQANPRGPAR